MKYKIQKVDTKYDLTVLGTPKQIEKLSHYWSKYHVDTYSNWLVINNLEKSQAQKLIDKLPTNLAKVKTNISHIYCVNYYNFGEKETFQDTRLEVAEKYLQKQLAETTKLANNVRSYKHKMFSELKLVTDKENYKLWKLDSYTVEFVKKPNNTNYEIKNRVKYVNALNYL